MENNYFNLRPKSLPDALSLRRWFCLILLSVIFTMANNEASAQLITSSECAPGKTIPFTAFAEDATSKTAADAKIRISGLPSGNYRIGLIGPTGTFGETFQSAKKLSELDNGYLSKTLPTPTDVNGQIYKIRIFEVTSSNAAGDTLTVCYVDKDFVLPYVNFVDPPKYVDIQVAVTTPSSNSPLDSQVTVTIDVTNASKEKGATGVIFKTAAAAGLQFVSAATPSQGNYDSATGTWDIGSIATEGAAKLILTYKVIKRGIHEVKAWNSALNETDIDSSPTQNSLPEDDQGQVCITTPFDFCKDDVYAYTITGTPQDIKWFKNGVAVTDADAEVADGGKTLNIKSIGTYTYTALFNEKCPATGCCPIVLEAGLPPILVKPNEQAICYNTNFSKVEFSNTQAGPFKTDQGGFTYQWYNNNGLDNPEKTVVGDSINGRGAGSIELPAALLPKKPGTYAYKIIAYQTNHKNCRDSVEFNLIINELPIVTASVNSPVCEEAAIKFDLTVKAAGGSTLPDLKYVWTGPASYTSDQEKPQIAKATLDMDGDYIVSVSYRLNERTCATSDTVNLVVNKLPEKPTVADITYCAQDKGEKLSASGTGVKILWYGPMGETPPVYGVGIPSDTTDVGNNVGPIPYLGAVGKDYYHVAQIDANGCVSHTAPLAIFTLTKPIKPVVEDLAYCQGSNAAKLTAGLTAPNGYELHWYTGNDTTGTSTVGNTYITPPTNDVTKLTYYVSQKTKGAVKDCESNMAKIDVYVKATPNAPGVTPPQPYCVGTTADPLIATVDAGNTPKWYWNGGNQTTAPTPSTTQSGGTWAYVSQTIVYTDPIPGKTGSLTCESAQSAIPIVVNPLPVANMIPISAICVAGTDNKNAELVLTRYRNSDEVSWTIGASYDSGTPTGFKQIGAGGVFASSLSNPASVTDITKYTVRIKNSYGCTIDDTRELVYKDCACPGYCEPAVITKTK